MINRCTRMKTCLGQLGLVFPLLIVHLVAAHDHHPSESPPPGSSPIIIELDPSKWWVVTWEFLLPIGVILGLARSQLHAPVQMIASLLLSLPAMTLPHLATRHLYPSIQISHSIMGKSFLLIYCIQMLLGAVGLLCVDSLSFCPSDHLQNVWQPIFLARPHWSHKDLQHTSLGVIWACPGGLELDIYLSGAGRQSVIPVLVIIITGLVFQLHQRSLELSARLHGTFGAILMQAAGLVKIIDVLCQSLAVDPRLEALNHHTPLPLTISGCAPTHHVILCDLHIGRHFYHSFIIILFSRVMFISATDSRGAADLKLSHRNGSCDLRLRSSLDRLSALPILPTYLNHFYWQVTNPSPPELVGARGTHELASDEAQYEHLDSRGPHIITRLGTSLLLAVADPPR
ncbi:hypothetical protein MJO29_006549 [Puccinia striiformis f. sp. tritici]|nr:hypothetical protein MJO29_006549 [Puccinia striiformis f. sp. tritici]